MRTLWLVKISQCIVDAEFILKFGYAKWQFNDSTEPALIVVVLSAGTRLYVLAEGYF